MVAGRLDALGTLFKDEPGAVRQDDHQVWLTVAVEIP